jgi:hypothetical protein
VVVVMMMTMFFVVFLGLAPAAGGVPGEWASSTPAPVAGGGYVRTFSYSSVTTYSPTGVVGGAGAVPGAVLYASSDRDSGGRGGGGGGGVCDCADKTISWKKLALSERDFSRLSGTQSSSEVDDDEIDDDDLSGGVTGGGSSSARSTSVTLMWAWDVGAEDTTDGLTIPPGDSETVWLGGDSTPGGDSRTYLGTDATARGMPCGVVYQDVFEATPVREKERSFR